MDLPGPDPEPPARRQRRSHGLPVALSAVAIAAAIGLGSFPAEAQSVRITTRPRLTLSIQPMNAGIPEKGPQPPYEFVVDAEDGGSLTMNLHWPDDRTACRVDLNVTVPDRILVEDEQTLTLDADLTLPGGRSHRASRNVRISDGETVLFAVAGNDRPLTLAIRAAFTTETVAQDRPSAGQPVLLQLEVQRVLEGRTISLERNDLSTFVGSSVGYSFRLGEAGEADAVEVRLTPLKIAGEIATVRVDISGTLPTGEGTEVISRSESWFCSKRIASTIPVESGDPPTGYRFLVTAHF